MDNNTNQGLGGFKTAMLLIGAAALYRLIPHPANIAPITAIALFGGAYLNKKYLAFVIPFAALYLSDLVLNNTILRSFYPDISGLVLFSEYMLGNLIAFGLIIIIGIKFLKEVTAGRVLVVSLVSSLLFFLITNLFSWMSLPIYPNNLAGLTACYSAGLAFFRPTILGDLLFTGSLFGIMELTRSGHIGKKMKKARVKS